MSNSIGTTTLSKSMNGLIVFNTGGGVVISGDTIVAGNIDLQNLNIDNIQGIAPADNITLYTDTTGNIRLGELSTSLNTISGATLDLRSTDLVFDTNNDTDFETGNNNNRYHFITDNTKLYWKSKNRWWSGY